MTHPESACQQLARVLAMEHEMHFPDFVAILVELCEEWGTDGFGTSADMTCKLAREALKRDGLA